MIIHYTFDVQQLTDPMNGCACAAFDIERIKHGGGDLGWGGELEQLAAKCGEKWEPYMTLASAAEAGLC